MSNQLTHCIWWHVYPLGFTGAPIRPTNPNERTRTPRLTHLESWLDYLIELGANGLALGPIFESDSHGYDTTNYYRIDPRLGDNDSFDQLANACARRAISLMLDGVFNHVGAGHPHFQTALAGGEHQHMFHIDHSTEPATYRTFEGHPNLPAVNHDDNQVAQHTIDVMKYWLRRGATAWRLDAAYAVPPEFWARVLPEVRQEFPNAAFIGEVIHGDYTDIVHRSTMTSVTQYELWKAIWSSLVDRNFFELDWCLQRHNDLLAEFTPLTFVGNHDVTRLATKVGDECAALAVIMLFTLGGYPSVYYGDERGYRGEKTDRVGGDDDVRPAYPNTPAENSPLGERMFRLHQEAIGFRRRHPWLTTATSRTKHLANQSYCYELVGPDGQLVQVALALEPAPQVTVTVDGTVELAYSS